MIGIFNDNDRWLLIGWKALAIGIRHVPANDTIIFTNKMDLRNRDQFLPVICRIERFMQWRHPVMAGPCRMIQVGGYGDELHDILAACGYQGGDSPAAGKTD